MTVAQKHHFATLMNQKETGATCGSLFFVAGSGDPHRSD
jgi:hypothetical protein